MFLARRNLLKDKTRLALSVGGVALAVMLILLLDGFLAGMYRQITSYLDHSPGDIVLAQSGVSNLLGATSLLPPDIANHTASVGWLALFCQTRNIAGSDSNTSPTALLAMTTSGRQP